MKALFRSLISLIISVLCFCGNAQNVGGDTVFIIEDVLPYWLPVDEIETQNDDSLQNTFVEAMPEFPGGPDSLNAYLSREIQYPPIAKNNGIMGTVLIEFVVEKDGRVTNGRVKVPLFPDCDVEALRAVMSLPNWKPGRHLGKPVRCYYQVPVRFRN